MIPILVITGFMAVLGFILHVSPQLSRPGTYFSVRVDAKHIGSPQARAALSRYRAWVWASTAAGMCLAVCGAVSHSAAMAVSGSLVQLAGAIAAIAKARRETLPHAAPPEPLGQAPTQRVKLPGGWPAHAGPYFLLACAAIALRMNWERIPERFPVHWGFSGPDRWAEKTLTGVFMLPAAGAAACLTMTVMAVALARSDARGEARYLRANLVALLASSYFMALLFGWLSIQAALFSGASPPVLIPALGSLLFVIVLVVWTARMRSLPSDENGGDGTPDSAWKGGMIYYNKSDSRLFVEKRFSVGYTVNFAHPASWLLIGVALLPAAVVGLMR